MNAEEIKRELERDWSVQTLTIWRRAGYKCEYCGKNMLQHPDIYYFDSHIDHINPAREDRNHIDNLALACRACNVIKRRRFPCDPNLPRDQIIIAIAAFLSEVRLKNWERLKRDRELIDRLETLDQR
jgi:5-methylcytosine-specific restriction endonuclease McrA